MDKLVIHWASSINVYIYVIVSLLCTICVTVHIVCLHKYVCAPSNFSSVAIHACTTAYIAVFGVRVCP